MMNDLKKKEKRNHCWPKQFLNVFEINLYDR